MKKLKLLILIGICMISVNKVSARTIHHSLRVKVVTEESYVEVLDTVFFKEGAIGSFYLNSSLRIYECNMVLHKVQISDADYDRYDLDLNSDEDTLIIKYKGNLTDNKQSFVNNDQGKRRGTKGLIFNGGVYLTGESYWVPYFKDEDLFTFKAVVQAAKDWHFVSQGELVAEEVHGSIKESTYEMLHPSNQVCIVGNKWQKYTQLIEGVKVNVFLIDEDQLLANKYLNVTGKYLKMYARLIGEFPYAKFDVVENFWETGYGMPSFTLLGSQVIRFPWILNSSYPHELLHNYWGNGVYVEGGNGNWSEGITTYMADYMLKEQDGLGTEFRRSMLKKYTDYVHEKNDFPVDAFVSKTDEVTEAIGYGKVLMVNHMLRKKIGPTMYLKAYGDFYQTNKFKRAGYRDIQHSFEKVTGASFQRFMDQWIHVKGAPMVRISEVEVEKVDEQYRLTFRLRQSLTANAFELEIPVYLYFDEEFEVEEKILELNQEEQAYAFYFERKPVRLDVDPNYDVMRRLIPGEVPATLSSLMGQDKWLIVLPVESEFYTQYKGLAQSWKEMYSHRGKTIEIIDDTELLSLPDDKSVWLFGKDNKQAHLVDVKRDYSSLMDLNHLQNLERLDGHAGSVVYALPNPDNPQMGIGYVNANEADVIGQLARKLMHYGSYGYLGFEGAKMMNVVKGSFPVLNSPMKVEMNKGSVINWSNYIYPKNERLLKINVE